jgi:iron complex outermembrane receptor protein
MMPHRIINQLRINYKEAGAGDAILFLHGLGSCAQDWLLQMPVLEAV